MKVTCKVDYGNECNVDYSWLVMLGITEMFSSLWYFQGLSCQILSFYKIFDVLDLTGFDQGNKGTYLPGEPGITL